jgi:23S rRNA (adenine2030-N6)-methyltransferase
MNLKDKGWRYIDTHAGAGGYSLQGDYAKKRAEFEHGIAALMDKTDLPAPLAELVRLVREFNGNKGLLVQYPGSPAIARALMRPQDQLRLYEMHPTDHKILDSYMEEVHGVDVKLGDGYASLKSQLPPTTKRGVVLIDPPYEIKTDYLRVLGALREALERFPDCVVIIWLPQLQLVESAQLPQRLKAAADAGAKKGWLNARLTVAQADARGFGMLGSSVFIANPPHTLHDDLQPVMPYLTHALAQFDGARSALERSAKA